MVELDQFRYRISGYDKPMAQIKNSLDLDNKQKRIEELEADMESPGFWDNPDKSQNAMKELKGLKDAFERYNELETGLDDVKTLIEMAEESNDQSLIPEIEEEITNLEDKMESLRIETLLSGEHDACDAILTLHAGAGGTESGRLFEPVSPESQDVHIPALQCLQGARPDIRPKRPQAESPRRLPGGPAS